MPRRKIGLSKNSGIYCFENKINGKKYIGQALNIDKRVSNHFGKLEKNNDSDALQNAWNKYGEDNFSIYVIEECEKIYLSEREMFYINEFNSKSPLGYNLTDGGEAPSGYTHTEEWKKNARIRMSGKNNPNFGKVGEQSHRFGKETPQDVKDKISKSLLGIKHTLERIKNQSESHIGKQTGELNYFYGKNHSGENNPNFGKKKKNSTSKYYGVYRHQTGKYLYWQVAISKNMKTISIGLYKEEILAAKAYDKYIIENNFPNPLNFPEKYS